MTRAGSTVGLPLVEELLPVYDVSDAVATVADVDADTAWEALLDVDLVRLGRQAPLVGLLGALRVLPELVGHLLRGRRAARPPASMRLRDMASIPLDEGGWILLGERPGQEIALGLLDSARRDAYRRATASSRSNPGLCVTTSNVTDPNPAPRSRPSASSRV